MQQLPNPFFGNPNVPRSLSTPATLSRSRLLRPFPQYGQINARQVTEGLSRYNAAVFELTKRMSQGLRRPVQLHLQRAEGQPDRRNELLLGGQPGAGRQQLQLHRVDAGVRGRQQFTTACYDPFVGVRLQHARRAAPACCSRRSCSCRSAAGKNWANGARGRSARRRLDDHGGDHACRAASRSTSSRRPTSRLGGQNANRPNLTGADLATPGNLDDRLGSADHPLATWLNPAAFSAGAGRNVRQHAADDHRRSRTRLVRRRCGVHQGHPVRAEQGRRSSSSRS